MPLTIWSAHHDWLPSPTSLAGPPHQRLPRATPHIPLALPSAPVWSCSLPLIRADMEAMPPYRGFGLGPAHPTPSSAHSFVPKRTVSVPATTSKPARLPCVLRPPAPDREVVGLHLGDHHSFAAVHHLQICGWSPSAAQMHSGLLLVHPWAWVLCLPDPLTFRPLPLCHFVQITLP